MRYFGNFNLEFHYCGILQTCGMCFLYVLVDDIRYKNVSFTFFRPFIAVSGRFGSTLKRSYFFTHFVTVLTTRLRLCHCFHRPPLVFASIFALASRNPPAIQAYYEIAVFSDFFAVLRYLSKMRCSVTPNVPLLNIFSL